jgi:hypothetical protein
MHPPARSNVKDSSVAVRIGELAFCSGVSVKALWHYEDIGVLAPAVNTMKTYVKAICRKLDMGTRHDAVQWARHFGLT